MFSYRPPKSSIWGHAIRPKDPIKARLKVNAFFEKYFERLEPEWNPTKLTVDDFNLHNTTGASNTGAINTRALSWNVSVLPNIEWHEEFLKPENERWQKIMFMLMGDRITFMMGLLFPISLVEPTSYEFLRRFSADAPFKMSSKHFQVGISTGKKGKLAWRKPDADISARLQQAIV